MHMNFMFLLYRNVSAIYVPFNTKLIYQKQSKHISVIEIAYKMDKMIDIQFSTKIAFQKWRKDNLFNVQSPVQSKLVIIKNVRNKKYYVYLQCAQMHTHVHTLKNNC